MEAVRAYYDGRVFVPTGAVLARKNQSAIVTILDEARKNKTKETLLSLAGILSEEEYHDFIDALKDTERVDVGEW
ncbi:MAG: hypothetical protein FWH32_02010 [Clostridiales bacterium]|nr:hypothetical protein [Clostridiales bacterium]